MRIKLWGVRGSIPTPLNTREYRDRLRDALQFARETWQKTPDAPAEQVLEELPPEVSDVVGGETTCVEVVHGDSQLIFDLGTGARRLGYDMMARGIKGDVHVLMTHTHWDHIQGWPFFAPGYIPGNRIHFYSALENCHERFQRQQHFDHFPVEFDATMSEKRFHLFQTGDSFEVGPFQVATATLMHPGGSVAYRVEVDGKRFIFATDTEFFGENGAMHDIIEDYRSFFEGADLLLMDAQYSLEEAQQKIGWGHTAMLICVDCAVAWNVKKLLLTHHEPAHLDHKIRGLYNDALRHKEETAPDAKLAIELAIEGDEHSLE